MNDATRMEIHVEAETARALADARRRTAVGCFVDRRSVRHGRTARSRRFLASTCLRGGWLLFQGSPILAAKSHISYEENSVAAILLAGFDRDRDREPTRRWRGIAAGAGGSRWRALIRRGGGSGATSA